MKTSVKAAILALFSAMMAFGQTYGNFSSLNGGTPEWVSLGTITLSQGGFNGLIRMYSGQGYNAANFQNGSVDLFIRTSNGLSTGPNGFCASAFASRFVTVQDSSGATSPPNSFSIAVSTLVTEYIRLGGRVIAIEHTSH